LSVVSGLLYSQGSVAIHLRCIGIFDDYFISKTFTAESDGERLLKIGPQFWRSYGQESSVLFLCFTFLHHFVYSRCIYSSFVL